MVINYCCQIKVDRCIKIRLGYRFHDGRVCFLFPSPLSRKARTRAWHRIPCRGGFSVFGSRFIHFGVCGCGCQRKEQGDRWHINLGILPQISPPCVFCWHLQCAAPNFEGETACAPRRAERRLSHAASRIALSPHRASQQDESGNWSALYSVQRRFRGWNEEFST